MTLPRIKQLDLFGGNGYYRKGEKRNWLIPPEIYGPLDEEFHFDFDPCPYPYVMDGTEIDWGKMNWVNPPFTRRDAMNKHGATAFARKAIEEQHKGNTTVYVTPVPRSIYVLLQAKPEIRFIGRIPWLDVETKEPSTPNGWNVLFILRGKNE